MTDEVEKKDPFAAARAAKAAKREAERLAAESQAKGETPAPQPEQEKAEPALRVEEQALASKVETARLLAQPSYEHKSVWLSSLQVAMRNREVKAAPDVKACVAIADEVLNLYKDKFK